MLDTGINNRKLGFHIIAKPTGSLCNLNCEYCFYLEKEKLYADEAAWAMPDDVLEAYVRQYIEGQSIEEIDFAWQGGEPTILGIDFFQKVVGLQKKYAAGKHITNAFQTNGVLLDDKWGEFLSRNRFLVGVSIDGPRKLHDHYRKDRGGGPTFDKVMKGISYLRKHNVEFNVLICVQKKNSYKPLEVYNFFKELGTNFVQFIPIVERITDAPDEEGLTRISPDFSQKAEIAPWSVDPLQYGKFLSVIFDQWVQHDVGKYYVQIFDISLEAWLGMEPSLCVFSRTCGRAAVIEHNGDLYSCDHFVYPENKLGNIMETSIKSMIDSEQQLRFGLSKLDDLPQSCKECPVRFVCNGDCLKHRFTSDNNDTDKCPSYFCDGYKYFFNHIDKYMKIMANEVRHQRPAANVMRYIRLEELEAQGKTQPGPNEACVCGSGRKFKKCCGRKV